MSKIQSASTITLTAYLTGFGKSTFLSFGTDGVQKRFILDQNGNYIDNFQVKAFSLYDSDVNYNAVNPLESGDVPALSGKKNSINKTITNNNRLIF